MRLLLDTHTFLWWNMDAPQLSEAARGLISSSEHEVFVSAATAWELAIKARKGRLSLPEPPGEYVATRLAYYHFKPLPVQINHACQTYHLPDIHADPFDRLLVAQCLVENLTLVSADPRMRGYAIHVAW